MLHFGTLAFGSALNCCGAVRRVMARAALASSASFVFGCGVDSRSFPADAPIQLANGGMPNDDGVTGAAAASGSVQGGGAVGGGLAEGGSGSENPPLAGAGPLDPGPGDPKGPPGPGRDPLCAEPTGVVPPLALEEVATGLSEPIFVTGVPGDATRLFVLQKAGAVRVIVNGQLQAEPFLDITPQVHGTGERGLLGLAFHPAYAENGLFYLHFSSYGGAVPQGDGIISEFQVDPSEPNRADPATQRQLLIVDQPEQNHNGGMISFGPDGFLYIAFGDGGGGNDQHGTIGNGQALDTWLGKLLRIDVDGRSVNGAYAIPAGNLAAQTGQVALPEIWAFGLRNPWRFSFDACNGDLYVGDVGQGAFEEVDYLPANTLAGTNFGWRIMEGPGCRPNEAACTPATQTGMTLPVDSYARDIGRSVTGGYVYRGQAIPGLRGHYIYADYATSRFFRFRMAGGQMQDRTEITSEMASENGAPTAIASFGQDNAGEIYIAAFTPGAVYRVISAPQK